jgi:hypothetical protein
MSESFRALCSDFYVNQRLNLKLDLPRSRETSLDLFERVRKQFPPMTLFRKVKEELALESPQVPGDQVSTPHRWLALRSTSIRSGTVNASSLEEAYALHKLMLEIAPFYLNISPLDVDYLELLFGFDLLASGNHDAIVYDALLAGSPLAALLHAPGAVPVDCQPLIGMALNSKQLVSRSFRGQPENPLDLEVHFEVKTRTPQGPPRDPEGPGEPISVYLPLRRFGAVDDVKDLVKHFELLRRFGEELCENRVLPSLVVPLRDAIASANG